MGVFNVASEGRVIAFWTEKRMYVQVHSYPIERISQWTLNFQIFMTLL